MCRRPDTIRGYNSVFELFIKVMPEVTSVDLLTEAMLNEFFKRLQTRPRMVGNGEIRTGVKNTTIKTYWTKLNTFFEWLEKKEYITVNPLGNIPAPRVSYNDFKRLYDSDINKIYSSIVTHSRNSFMFHRDTLMVSLFVYTGMRRGEFISLQLRDINMYKMRITIRGETSKSGKTRTLPIHPTLLFHLENYFIERNKLGYKTEFVITSSKKDEKLTLDGLKHWVKKIIEISGVKFHPHLFRHTYACKIIEGHTPTASLQKLLGHSQLSMTEKYTRSLRAEDMMEEVSKISF